MIVKFNDKIFKEKLDQLLRLDDDWAIFMIGKDEHLPTWGLIHIHDEIGQICPYINHTTCLVCKNHFLRKC